MAEVIYFKPSPNFPIAEKDIPLPGNILWCRYYADESHLDFMMIPLRVLKVYGDGSWDGELIEGEA